MVGVMNLHRWGYDSTANNEITREYYAKDSGTSHNFISSDLVYNLGLKIDPINSYNMVRLGDRYRKQTQIQCKGPECEHG